MLDRMTPEDRLWFAIIGTLAVLSTLGLAWFGWLLIEGAVR